MNEERRVSKENRRDDLFLELLDLRDSYQKVAESLFKARIRELFETHPALDCFQWTQSSDYNDSWHELWVTLERINGGEVSHAHFRYDSEQYEHGPPFGWVPEAYDWMMFFDPKYRKDWEEETGKYSEQIRAAKAVWALFNEFNRKYTRKFFRAAFGAHSVNYVTREGIRQTEYVAPEDNILQYARGQGLI